MTDKRYVVVVCGHGCHLDTPLSPYLDRVVRFINNLPQEICLEVIFCGGFTQKSSAPGVSEAYLMSEYISHHPEIRRKYPYSVVREDNSYTTYENIQKAASIMSWNIDGTLALADNKIIIFCEATRAANVVMLARHFMGDLVESVDDITVETASWERADPFKQVGNLIYNKLAITLPWLGLAEREHRKRIKRAEHI